MGWAVLFLIIAQIRMSYFHSVFSKHTNTSFQPLTVPFDRVSPLYYQTELPANFGNLILNMYIQGIRNVHDVKSFTFFVNDEPIQSFTGEYMYINEYLKTPAQKSVTMDKYIVVPIKKYIPVFPGNKIVIEMNVPTTEGDDVNLVIDFLFVDPLPKPTDMLIEQVQFVDEYYPGGKLLKINLQLKHIIKELVFVVQNISKTGTLDYSNAAGLDQITQMKIDINQFTKVDQPGIYFSKLQPLDYHTRVPDLPSLFYTYSFCLDPESEFPTGTINMGMIKNQTIYMTFRDEEPKNIRIYAIGYNVIAPDGKLIFV